MEAAVVLGRGARASATSPPPPSSGSRDANRFMARLALGPQAVLRVATTPRRARQAHRPAARAVHRAAAGS